MSDIIDNSYTSISYQHINATFAFVYLLSLQFYLRSYTIISDFSPKSYVDIYKMASEFGLELTILNFTGVKKLKNNEEKGYLVFENSKKNYLKVIKAKPKLIAGVFIAEKGQDTNLTEFFSDYLISHKTTFFAIKFINYSTSCSTIGCPISGESFFIYRPVTGLTVKVFPAMKYLTENETFGNWTWVSKNLNWIALRKKTFDLKELTLTVALASVFDNKTALKLFWAAKNSFFWKQAEIFLKFKAHVHIEHIEPDLLDKVTRVYMKLLMSNTDGLGILPVITTERSQYLDFIVTGLDSRFHLMVRPPQFIHSWQSIFKPFTSGSWICLGITIFLISITLRIITYQKNIRSMDFLSCFLVIFGFVCGQGSANIPKIFSARIACYTALLFSFSIYQFYTSNFYSLLSTKEVSLPFTSLEQFLEKRSHKMYIHPDTAIYSQITKAQNGTFRRLWDEVLKKDPNHQLKSDKSRGELLDNVCKGKGAIFGLPYQMQVMSELKCKLVTVNSGYFPTNVVSVFRKRFAFKSQFKFVHMRLLEGGISHKYRDEFLTIERKRTIRTNVTNEPVSLEHIAFLIVFYAVSVLCSLGILGLEIVASKSFGKSNKFKFK